MKLPSRPPQFERPAEDQIRNPRVDPAARLSVADAITRCRDNLQLQLDALGRPLREAQSLEPLRATVAEFASVAARERMPPERVLVVFKRTVGQLADMQGRRPEERDAITRRLVEMTIDAYYAEAPEAPASD